MFDLFRRRKPGTRDIFKAAADATYDALFAQISFLRDDELYISNDGENFNRTALGYIFGFFDATLRKLGLDIRDDEGVSVMPYLLARLFPKETDNAGTYVGYLKQNMYHDPEALNSMQLGEQEANDLLEKSKPPTSLARCISEYIQRGEIAPPIVEAEMQGNDKSDGMVSGLERDREEFAFPIVQAEMQNNETSDDMLSAVGKTEGKLPIIIVEAEMQDNYRSDGMVGIVEKDYRSKIANETKHFGAIERWMRVIEIMTRQ
jgi:hypothetical protein